MPKIFVKEKHGIVFECAEYRGDPVTHMVFENKGDFEKYFMTEDGVVPKFEENWRDAQEMSWVHADDGRVCQILKHRGIKHPHDSVSITGYRYAKKGYVVTAVGSFICREDVFMDTDFSLHPSRNSFVSNGNKIKNVYEKLKDRKHITANEAQFVMNLVKGDTLAEAYRKVYKVTSKKTALKYATILIRQDRIMRLLKKQLEDTASKLGVTIEYIMRGIKGLADGGKVPATVKLEAFSRLGKYIGMDDEEQTSGTPLGAGFESEREKLGEHNGEPIKLDRPDGADSFDHDEPDEVEHEIIIDQKSGDPI